MTPQFYPPLMKTQSSSRLRRAAALAGCFACPWLAVSCQTTGDPHTGGIFWSESKAQERLDQRQDELNRVDAQAAQARKNAQRKQAEASRLQQE